MTIISRAGQGIGIRLYYEEGKLEGSEGKKKSNIPSGVLTLARLCTVK